MDFNTTQCGPYGLIIIKYLGWWEEGVSNMDTLPLAFRAKEQVLTCFI